MTTEYRPKFLFLIKTYSLTEINPNEQSLIKLIKLKHIFDNPARSGTQQSRITGSSGLSGYVQLQHDRQTAIH